MERCSCYYQHGSKPVCYGTKEMEECSCGGDESKCNFYPEKRKQKMANEKRQIETTAVRCPGLPYPDYTELDKLLEEGWRVIRARCEPDDHCVWFTLERDTDALILIVDAIDEFESEQEW